MTEISSEELMSLIAVKDKAAFSALYARLEQPLFRFIQTRLNDPYQSADILHDVFLEIWRNAGAFQGRSSVRTWVFSIAYRKIMDVFRGQSRLAGEEEIPELADDGPDALDLLRAAEERDMLKHCLATLSPDHRMAVEMSFYHDMGYGEIAEVTQTPEGTVKTRIFHAKKLLLRCLQARMKAKVR